MPVSLNDFRERVIESGLVSQADLQALIADLPEEDRPADVEQLARLLVQNEKLTAFQAQQVYAGKGKWLTLGSYVILDKLGQGGMGLALEAEHQRMERLVVLSILSPAVNKNRAAVRAAIPKRLALDKPICAAAAARHLRQESDREFVRKGSGLGNGPF